jgi:hypothetical protein
VLLETRHVGLAASIAAPGYQRHLAPVLDFFSTSPVFRYLPDLGGGFDNPFYPLALIYALLILAGMALLFWLFVRPGTWGEDSENRRWHLLFFLVVTVGSIFMMLTWSLPLWRLARPILASLQYPWRFMALTSLGLAVLSAGLFLPFEGFTGETRRRWFWLRNGLGLGLLLLLMAYG